MTEKDADEIVSAIEDFVNALITDRMGEHTADYINSTRFDPWCKLTDLLKRKVRAVRIVTR